MTIWGETWWSFIGGENCLCDQNSTFNGKEEDHCKISGVKQKVKLEGLMPRKK